MKKFLKLAVIPMAFLVLGTTTSCKVKQREIALITDVGDIDDGSFNQESWEAVKEYANKNHKSYDFYRPFNDSEFARICAVKQAVAKGAKVIVLPGFKFASTCASTMKKYPDVHFLLIDSFVHMGDYTAIDPTPNVCCVGYQCEYSGYIAGYTIATDLLQRDLNEKQKLDPKYGYGYAGGMASDGVYQFGLGYIQGICTATADFCSNHNLTEPELLFDYCYAGVFAQDDATAIKVKSWYGTDGVKVVFACGGKLYQSVTEAAQYYNKHQKYFNYDAWCKGKLDKDPREAARWVGVDSDQYRGLKYDYEKKSIYTSALKGLNPAIMKALDLHYQGEWEQRIGGVHDGKQAPYGHQWILGLHSVFGDYENPQPEDYGAYVGIPEVFDEKTGIMRGFDNYTFDEFKDGLYAKLIADELLVYGGDGTKKNGNISNGNTTPGDPTNMQNWTLSEPIGGESSFRKLYMGDYDGEITISVK